MLFLVLVALSISCNAQSGPIVQTKYGPVLGNYRPTVDEWLGIPYSSPPIGDLRFKLPVPPQKWTDPRNCTVPPEECPQAHITKKDFKGSEDCLFVDIYRPAGTDPQANLPVMVFIHGGAYIAGNALGKNGSTHELYNGTNLAAKHSVIVVSVQYRLGIFGYLALPELMAESNSTGNYGLQDQRLALHWVQENIAAFGGDPTRVLLFGESAGGGSVCYHYTSPLSKGLFSSIIAESPVCSDPELWISYDAATTFGSAFIKHIGCGEGPLTLDCIRRVPTDEILNYLLEFPNQFHFPANASLPILLPVMPWGPVVDNAEIGVIDRPLNMIRGGVFNPVPTLMGSNENEGTIFVPMSYLMIPGLAWPITEAGAHSMIARFYNDTVATLALNQYPLSDYFDEFNRLCVMLRDIIFRCNIRAVIRAVQKTSANPPPTWIYRFNKTVDSPVTDLMGDFHGSELPFVFNNGWQDWKEADYTLSEQIGCFWSSMATHGTPNLSGCQNIIQWPENTGVDGDWNIALDWTLRTETGLSSDNCDFWDSVGYN